MSLQTDSNTDPTKRKSDHDDAEGGSDPKRIKKTNAVKENNTTQQLLREIPTSSHYQISFLHRATVTHVITSNRHGYVITACQEGIVKFWKRTLTIAPEEQQSIISGKDKDVATPCLEFVKSFTAHIGPLAALVIDPSEDTVASVGKDDGIIKFYDVSTFDATSMIKNRNGTKFGRAATFLQDASKELLLAIADSSSGTIFIYSIATLDLVQKLALHSKPVTAMAYNPHHMCCISGDELGILEVWDTTMGTKSGDIVGAPCSKLRNNGLDYPSKMDTDLYSLAKKKTYPRSISMSVRYFVIYGSDHKVRVFNIQTGKVEVRYDERLSVYASKSESFGMDSIEFGPRAAKEREMEDQQKSLPSDLVRMDPSEKLLFVSTMIGIKVIDWKKNKMLKVIGKADASQYRFLSFCLCLGDPNMDQQMQLARGVGGSTAVGDKKIENNSLVVALAYQQRRFYVFSHVDPFLDKQQGDTDTNRDIWNEPPTAQDQLLASETTRGGGSKQNTSSKAILRTTMGDVHIKLFPEVPKTLENFCTHARSGYYDNVIFHRVIAKFMLQTGDPLGDGTGGESIWGGEFEDEFVRDLRHDRPFTVSMANAGPNTNGSQFFITTVATPWLDNKHTVFGRVIKGMDVCTMIENVKTDKNDKPLEDIRILSVDIE
ncbi:peptidyl-prolyl cis-trans isomerase A [Nitzschia inconspicua]|uniref:peptidylprolyl isomerase n=1 Tax=Nitzschia inconspicua TaxID=303405 RepID=A0A9K3KAN2_9STRA|nr:peptidyl-prolyl cis-trans isomerase A [Nitzschia inconspicua]KAG7362381.1 peptidyl-prolyl cis-trans isomerase A [Nitzschia inconspicua]